MAPEKALQPARQRREKKPACLRTPQYCVLLNTVARLSTIFLALQFSWVPPSSQETARLGTTLLSSQLTQPNSQAD